MSTHHLRWMVAAVVGLWWTLAVFTPAAAEVRVRTDRNGEYRVTQVLTGGPRATSRIWGPVNARPDNRLVLNLDGDANGDLFPKIVESDSWPHHPWVVWSRYDGTEYDLAWSRWTPAGWEPIRWLAEGSGLPGDDLDADVSFSAEGRPYAVWWRNENGKGRIYLSLFLVHRWMAPYAVTDGSTDSRFPTVELIDGGEGGINVEYDTPDGVVSQLVNFDQPVTITDDINPLDHLKSSGPVPVSEQVP